MPAPLRARRMLVPMLLMSSIPSPCFGNILLIQPFLIPSLPDFRRICKILPKVKASTFPAFVSTGSRNIFPIFLLTHGIRAYGFRSSERQEAAVYLEAHALNLGCVVALRRWLKCHRLPSCCRYG
jgi:hypothetical protein